MKLEKRVVPTGWATPFCGSMTSNRPAELAAYSLPVAGRTSSPTRDSPGARPLTCTRERIVPGREAPKPISVLPAVTA